jgi:anti-sigma factor RsiW
MSDRQFTDDELLSALLDGALSPDDAARLEHRLEREPALRARLEALERANTAVRDAYAGVVDEPLPKQLLELLGTETAAADNVVPLAARQPRERRSFVPPTALAASIALAVGVALGVVLAPSRQAPDAIELAAEGGAVAPGSALFEMLERVPSAESRELSAGVTATPVVTFGTAGGGYCREVDVASTEGTTQMLACRRDGAWRLAHTSYVAGTSTDGVFRPAAGPSPAMDAAIDELIDGAPLDSAAERALLGSGWADAAR